MNIIISTEFLCVIYRLGNSSGIYQMMRRTIHLSDKNQRKRNWPLKILRKKILSTDIFFSSKRKLFLFKKNKFPWGMPCLPSSLSVLGPSQSPRRSFQFTLFLLLFYFSCTKNKLTGQEATSFKVLPRLILDLSVLVGKKKVFSGSKLFLWFSSFIKFQGGRGGNTRNHC